MASEENESLKDYIALRVSSRAALGRAGVATNIGFTDYDILRGMSSYTGQPCPGRYEEFDVAAGEMFRDSLAVVLGVELPTTASAVVAALAQIR
jgi:hypothetical protein